MEPIVFFGLGVVTVMAMGLIVGAVRLQKQVVDLQHEIKNLHKTIENQERYAEDRFRILEDINNTVDKRIDTETRELYRTIDSRFDKLENKLSTKK
jgi:predicted RNase H-like nuclease (RuvC/YqgF family)